MEIGLQLINTLYVFSTFSLFGLIWTIQLVHYPSFHFVEESNFLQFEKFHSNAISLIVIPLMLIELITSIAISYLLDFSLLSLVELGIIILVWISTAVFSVPCHQKLIKQKDTEVINRLVNTNWIRTSLWSASSAIILWKMTH